MITLNLSFDCVRVLHNSETSISRHRVKSISLGQSHFQLRIERKLRLHRFQSHCLGSVIGPKNSCHFFNQLKARPITTCTPQFPALLQLLRVIAPNSDWHALASVIIAVIIINVPYPINLLAFINLKPLQFFGLIFLALITLKMMTLVGPKSDQK